MNLFSKPLKILSQKSNLTPGDNIDGLKLKAMKKYVIALLALIVILLLNYVVARAQEEQVIEFEETDDICGLTLTSSIYRIDSVEYGYTLRIGEYSNDFTFADIAELIGTIKSLKNSKQSNIFMTEKLFIIKKLVLADNTSWSILVNSDQGNEFFELNNIDCFSDHLKVNAMTLLDLSLEY